MLTTTNNHSKNISIRPVTAFLLSVAGVIILTCSKAYHARANHDLMHGINGYNQAIICDALRRGADANSIDETIGVGAPLPQSSLHSMIDEIMGKPPPGDHWTVLMSAAREGETEAVKELLSYKASANARNKNGSTALNLAAYGGHVAVVKLLLEHGANVNLEDDEANTPLMSAAGSGNTVIVGLLLDRGAIVNTNDSHRYTPLSQAIDNGHTAVVKLLLTYGAKVEAHSKQDDSPLFNAAAKGYYNIAELLIAHGADVNAADSDGETPLWAAEMSGHPNIVALLKKAGAKEESPHPSPYHSYLIRARGSRKVAAEYRRRPMARAFGHGPTMPLATKRPPPIRGATRRRATTISAIC